jgi:hypothetical protein
MLTREAVHEPVAMRLGDDRRGRDREVDAVAFIEAVLRDVNAWDVARIDEHVLRADRQRLDGAPHREQAGVVDIDAVDLLDLGAADRDRDGDGADSALGVLALLEVELLRIVDARKLRMRRKHDRGGDHGTGHRTHSDLVDSRDDLHARAPQYSFEVQHCIQPRALDRVALVSLLERLVELAHAVARVSFELVQRLRRDGLVRPRIALPDLVDR